MQRCSSRIAQGVDLRPVVQQDFDDLDAIFGGGKVKRRPAIAVFGGKVSPRLEDRLGRLRVISADGDMQGGLSAIGGVLDPLCSKRVDTISSFFSRSLGAAGVASRPG